MAITCAVRSRRLRRRPSRTAVTLFALMVSALLVGRPPVASAASLAATLAEAKDMGVGPLVVRQWQRVAASIFDLTGPGIPAAAGRLEETRLDALAAEANRYVNDLITFRADTSRDDVWQTGEETLARRSGDCEDFAILKAQILMAAGVDPSDLALVVGWASDGRPHAVLVVAGRLVLDNKIRRAMPIESVQFRAAYAIGFDNRLLVNRDSVMLLAAR